jgi:hypothetical protein
LPSCQACGASLPPPTPTPTPSPPSPVEAAAAALRASPLFQRHAQDPVPTTARQQRPLKSAARTAPALVPPSPLYGDYPLPPLLPLASPPSPSPAPLSHPPPQPLLQRRCRACVAAGRPGLLTSAAVSAPFAGLGGGAGGPHSSSSSSSSSAQSTWRPAVRFRKQCPAAGLLPRVELLPLAASPGLLQLRLTSPCEAGPLLVRVDGVLDGDGVNDDDGGAIAAAAGRRASPLRFLRADGTDAESPSTALPALLLAAHDPLRLRDDDDENDDENDDPDSTAAAWIPPSLRPSYALGLEARQAGGGATTTRSAATVTLRRPPLPSPSGPGSSSPSPLLTHLPLLMRVFPSPEVAAEWGMAPGIGEGGFQAVVLVGVPL